MNDKLNDRRIFKWHGRNLAEDTSRLTDAIAESCIAEVFELNGSLVWFNDGQPVPISRTLLREIIALHIVSIRLVNLGPRWQVEYYAFDFPQGADTSKEPDEKVLTSLMNDLISRVPRGPSTARKLSEQQQREVQARLKMGEAKERIADAYGVDLATIRQLAR
jgi:hypothetical protein